MKPEFIHYAGIGASLTPGRNNGFLNMLKVMKVKARQLEDIRGSSGGAAAGAVKTPAPAAAAASAGGGGKPVYAAVVSKLNQLQPRVLVVEDKSHKHAGHAGTARLSSTETHFSVTIVADAFEGKSLVQRHKMIYTLLAIEMSGDGGIHALSINAKAPGE